MHHQVGLPSRYVYSSFQDESTGVPYTDEQHVGPETWAPGGTDENPDAGATGTYETDIYSPHVEGHWIMDSVDVGRDPMSSHILHTSSAVDGPVQVQPGAAHIGDGYRQSSYRPEGDARGFTTGGADLGSRKVAEEAAPVRNTRPPVPLSVFTYLPI